MPMARSIKVRRSRATRIAAQIGKMARDGHDWCVLGAPIDAFLEAHRETIIRAVLPNLKPDGKGGFSVLRSDSRTKKLRRVDISGDFCTFSIDGDARCNSIRILLAELSEYHYGSEAGLILFAAAAMRILLPRERRA